MVCLNVVRCVCHFFLLENLHSYAVCSSRVFETGSVRGKVFGSSGVLDTSLVIVCH